MICEKNKFSLHNNLNDIKKNRIHAVTLKYYLLEIGLSIAKLQKDKK